VKKLASSLIASYGDIKLRKREEKIIFITTVDSPCIYLILAMARKGPAITKEKTEMATS